MKEIYGDLIKLTKDGNFDVMVHGCNCFCRMKSGIAKTVSEEFPEAVLQDNNTIIGDLEKLGTFTKVDYEKFTVINAYTQGRYGYNNQIYADYGAIKKVFEAIAKYYPNKRIGYPLIGCGLAGGNWKVVSKIINKALKGMDHTLVRFK